MTNSNSVTQLRAGTGAVAISNPLQLASALLLGLVMLYGAGFVQTSAVHNAAHDARHSVGFPCH
jgi:cobalt transporter subunit CbtB